MPSSLHLRPGRLTQVCTGVWEHDEHITEIPSSFGKLVVGTTRTRNNEVLQEAYAAKATSLASDMIKLAQ